MIRIRFDGPNKPEIISVEPDHEIEYTEWIRDDGDDWILVIHFNSRSRFGWTGDQVRILPKKK